MLLLEALNATSMMILLAALAPNTLTMLSHASCKNGVLFCWWLPPHLEFEIANNNCTLDYCERQSTLYSLVHYMKSSMPCSCLKNSCLLVSKFQYPLQLCDARWSLRTIWCYRIAKSPQIAPVDKAHRHSISSLSLSGCQKVDYYLTCDYRKHRRRC
jgi:hypothetical protein